MNIIWYKEGKNDGIKKRSKISSQEQYKRGKMKPENITHFDVEFLIEKNIFICSASFH